MGLGPAPTPDQRASVLPGAQDKRLVRVITWVRRNPVTAVGLLIVLAILTLGLLAPLVAPYDPYALNPGEAMQAPSWRHLFGTGLFGEDIFSRVLYGARIDLGIGAGAVAIALLAGCSIGALAGFFGGIIDELGMRSMDVIAAFPSFILAMAIAGILGPSIPNLIIAIGIVNVPVYARLMRARFLVIRGSTYAMAARGVGASRWRVLWWHLLPNSLAPIFVQSTLQFGWAVLDAAGLSFIGLGVQIPLPEWGSMISLGVTQIISGNWWISFFPGFAIAVTVMGFNLIGDGLQDLFDPRKR